jgi:acyl-CoA hydrolase
MENFGIVRSEHLNSHGILFGGQMLKWVDEYAWISATRDFPGCVLTTIGMDHVEFKKTVDNGSILRFDTNWAEQGRSSVTYAVDVYSRTMDAEEETVVFTTRITYVRVDQDWNKCLLPKRPNQ